MDYRIIDIFPTAVMKFKLGRNLNKAEIDFVNLHESKHYQNAGNTYSRNTFILNEDEMNHISEFCNNSLQIYFEKVINPFMRTYVSPSFAGVTTIYGLVKSILPSVIKNLFKTLNCCSVTIIFIKLFYYK